MSWFYELLITSGVETVAASWATAAVAVILVFYVLRSFIALFSK